MKKTYISIIYFIVLVVGCENESPDIEPNNNELNKFDTIFPGDYLPAYPGSYWIYNDGDTITTGEKYELSIIYDPRFDISTGVEIFDTCIPIDTAYFPIYDNKVLNRYTTYSYGKGHCSKFRLLDETEGIGWTISSSKMDRSGMSVKGKGSTIVLPNQISYDSVIVMVYNYTIQNYDVTEYEYYYAKHIGFIGSKIIYDQICGIDTAKWGSYLINYKIFNKNSIH
jgi:hypothetical protein